MMISVESLLLLSSKVMYDSSTIGIDTELQDSRPSFCSTSQMYEA